MGDAGALDASSQISPSTLSGVNRPSPFRPISASPLESSLESPAMSPMSPMFPVPPSPPLLPLPAQDPVVFISIERLRELEAMEQRIPTLIEKAIQDHKKEKLKLLHERDRLDPTAVNLRVKRYALKHRDEINAKRRLKRKEAAIALIQPTAGTPHDGRASVERGEDPAPAATYHRIVSTLTVRFDE